MKIEPYKEKYADVRDAINYLLQFKNGIVLEPMPQVDCKLAHSEDVDIFVFDFRMRFLVKEYHDNDGKQKFSKGMFVWISNDERLFDGHDGRGSMLHFERNCLAVVEGSFVDLYGSGIMGEPSEENYKEYSLVLLDANLNPFNSCAWYREEQLSLVSNNTERGKQIINKYREVTL